MQDRRLRLAVATQIEFVRCEFVRSLVLALVREHIDMRCLDPRQHAIAVQFDLVTRVAALWYGRNERVASCGAMNQEADLTVGGGFGMNDCISLRTSSASNNSPVMSENSANCYAAARS